MKLSTAKLQSPYLSGEDHLQLVADCPPTARTILLGLPNDNRRYRLFIRLPYMRFVIGTAALGTGAYFWDRTLHLFGSIRPFRPNEVGFAIPLPNFNTMGFLTCPGSMQGEHVPTLQEIAPRVLHEFWCTEFYTTFDQSFPVLDQAGMSISSINDLWELKNRGIEVYRNFRPVSQVRLQGQKGLVIQ